jgi:hypothetical protein
LNGLHGWRNSLLLEHGATRHQTLFDLVSRKLHIEIARKSLHDFVQAEIERLQRGYLVG